MKRRKLSQNERRDSFRSRCLFAAGLLGVGALVLIGRSVQMQIYDQAFLNNQADARQIRLATLSAHRGTITDRNGEVLAVSTPVDSIWVDPRELMSAPENIPRLARLLKLEEKGLVDKLSRNASKGFLFLRRHMNPSDAELIIEAGVQGVHIQREYRRYYPSGEVTGHLVGFANIDDQGQEGLELAFDHRLAGVPGSKRVLKDRTGQTVEDIELIQAPEPGHDITTSIDLRIQYLAYRELKKAVQTHKASSGSAVVVDVLTGEVLAMVNQPSYNPNDRSQFRASHYRNRAITDIFEPGSSIKPLVVAAALESGDYTPKSIINTSPGRLQVGAKTITDKHNLGKINLATMLSRSSNVGASMVTLSLDPAELWGVFDSFGLGHPTKSGFPGESAGVFSHYQNWRPISQATLAYGYGVSITPLQLTQAYAVLGGEGLQRPVSLLKVNQPPIPRRVISAQSANEVLGMMEHVVAEGGTGTQAAVPGFRVAGKTGTTVKATGGSYEGGLYTAIFAGVAPASNPRLAVVVVIDEPKGGQYYGGLVAAPVFSSIVADATRVLAINPDALDDASDAAVQGGATMMPEQIQQTGISLVDLFPDLAAGLPEIFVRDMTTDSRRAVTGGLFLACRGVEEHGLKFVRQAIDAGVSVVAWEPEEGLVVPELPESVFGLEVPDLGARVGDLAGRFFDKPSEQIAVTGITGTNGKTTTAWLVSEALGRLAGKTAYMGTLGYGVLPKLEASALTTPGVVAVHRRMHGMAAQGVTNLVMEVSSHALDQGRIDGVRLQTAAFTNLSRDHLDYHGDLKTYKQSKARLFSGSGLQSAVINIGDEFGLKLAKNLAGRVRIITVAMTAQLPAGAQADLSASYEELPAGGLQIKFSDAYGAASLHSKLWGGFNAENLLVAAGILIARGFSLDEALTALHAGSAPPGRMQVVNGGKNAPAVVIDFAHTPDALAKALGSVRKHVGGRLICVFGCGGNRDRGKRSEMGAVAGQLADHTVLTSDNPRDEDPLAIINDIVAGIETGSSYEIETDRRAAIEAAISKANSDDAVLIAGKGSESFQYIGGQATPFSDCSIAQETLGAMS